MRRSNAWRGGRTRNAAGYVMVWRPEHPRANGGRYVMEHIVVAERALGRLLSRPHVVHHVNGQRDDNRPENLVVCENQAYHNLIEKRTRAHEACGHADWARCEVCKEYGPDVVIYQRSNGYEKPIHRACNNARTRDRRRRRRRKLLAELQASLEADDGS